MTDVATSAAVCVATGTLSATFCAAFGFDPTLLLGGVVGGFTGCLIVQTLIPSNKPEDLLAIVKMMIGSVLFSGLMTMLVSPWAIRNFNLEGVPPGAVRLAIGAVLGGLAQPLVILGRRKVLKYWKGADLGKENGNA